MRRNVLFPVMLLEEVEIPLEFEHLHAAQLMDWQPDQAHSGFDQFVQDMARILGSSSGVGMQPFPLIQPQAQPPSQLNPKLDYELPPDREDQTGQEGRCPKPEPPTPPAPPHRYILIGAGLLLAIGAIVPYGVWSQDSSTTPSSGKTDGPSAPATVEPTRTQSPVATPPPAPGPAPSENPSTITAQEIPTVTPNTTEVRTTATKPRSIASPATNITGKDGAPMVLIPEGEFWMGSPDGEGNKNEHPRHTVALSAFYLDKYEVTNRLFHLFVQQTSHRTTAEREGKAWALKDTGNWEEVSGAHWRKPEGGESVFVSNREEHPVVSVSWEDAQAYCRWTGKRLPTEAEFEYATRAGTETKYWWGNGNLDSRQVANIGDESMKRQYSNWTIMTGYDDAYVRTSPVGSFEANPFGLHDMTGNVWEWTADRYDVQYYGNSPRKNPQGSSNEDFRVLRGGSWFSAPVHVRSAARFWSTPTYRSSPLGFRCAQDSQK